MNILFNNNLAFSADKIIGSWNNHQYNIIRKLGSGENGTVYLVELESNEYALKLSNSTDDLNYEIQAIYRLNKDQGLNLGFSVFDIDDWNHNGKIKPFYVMSYKKAITIKQHLYGRNPEEYFIVFRNVIKKLKLLHDAGWAFGDLKPEHLLIEPITKEIHLIDFGGITRFNEGIRQYTELYDRGKWKAGSRKADQHFDLFALCLAFLSLNIGENKLLKFLNRSRGINGIYDIIRGIHNLKLLTKIIRKILEGQITTSNEALLEMENMDYTTESLLIKPRHRWIDILFASSFLLFVVMLFFLIFI